MAIKASSGALSTLALDPSDEQYIQALRAAQANLREALDNRSEQAFDPVLLAMAQGFLSPTKTGSFGEVLGNVAAQVGPAQQSEEKRAREVASMKMELASNELAQHRATQGMRAGLNLLSGNRGPAPAGQPTAPAAGQELPDGQTAAPSQAPSGQAPTGAPAAPVSGPRNITGNDLNALRLMGQKDLAEGIAKGIELDRGRYHVSNDMIVDKDAAGGPKVIADLRISKQEPTEIVYRGQSLMVNMNQKEQRDYLDAVSQGRGDEYYDRFLKGRRTDVNLPARGGALREIYVPLLGDIRFQGTDRQAAIIERMQEEAVESGNPTQLRNYVNSITRAIPMPTAPAAPAGAKPTAAPAAAPGQPPAAGRQPPAAQPSDAQPQPVSDLSKLPIVEQNKVIVERLSLADKPAQLTMETLMKSAGPESTISSNRRLKELVDITNKHPNVVGLMNKQGTLAGILAASQEGIRAGNVQVSLPVTTFLEKQKLSPQDQQIARRVAQLLDEEFFTRAAIAKSALGPQISNTDAVAMRSPMARPEDGAALIRYWSLHGVVVNKQNDDLVSAYNSWMDRTKGNQPTRQFWNTEGRKILNQYTPYFEKLQQDFYPNMPR